MEQTINTVLNNTITLNNNFNDLFMDLVSDYNYQNIDETTLFCELDDTLSDLLINTADSITNLQELFKKLLNVKFKNIENYKNIITDK